MRIECRSEFENFVSPYYEFLKMYSNILYPIKKPEAKSKLYHLIAKGPTSNRTGLVFQKIRPNKFIAEAS